MGDSPVDPCGRRRMGYLALSTVALLFLGLIYAFSMFAAPLGTAFGLDASAVSLTFNIMMIAFCLGAVVGSVLLGRLGVRRTLLAAAVLVAGGFAGTGLLGGAGIVVVYACYGVAGGAGVGIGYNVILSTTNAWFPEKVGFSSGVMLMGFGLGSLVLGSAAVALLSQWGLPTVFVGIGISTGTVTAALALVLAPPPREVAAVVDDADGRGRGSAVADASSRAFFEADDKPLKTPVFYVYWLWETIILAIGLATIGSCASDARMVGIDAGFATLLVGLVSTCNGLARVVVGVLSDRTNVRTAMAANAAVAVCATAFIVGAFAWQVGSLYVAGALLCGFCYGGIPVITSAFVRVRFGALNYPLNLSIGNFAIVYGAVANMALQVFLGPTLRAETFVVLAVASFATLALLVPFSRMGWRGKEVRGE